MSPEYYQKYKDKNFKKKINHEKSEVYSLGITLLKNYFSDEEIDSLSFITESDGQEKKIL
jgi:hypothetical protein